MGISKSGLSEIVRIFVFSSSMFSTHTSSSSARFPFATMTIPITALSSTACRSPCRSQKTRLVRTNPVLAASHPAAWSGNTCQLSKYHGLCRLKRRCQASLHEAASSLGRALVESAIWQSARLGGTWRSRCYLALLAMRSRAKPEPRKRARACRLQVRAGIPDCWMRLGQAALWRSGGGSFACLQDSRSSRGSARRALLPSAGLDFINGPVSGQGRYTIYSERLPHSGQ